MRKLHKKPLVLAAAAIALTGSLTVGSAMAYFTTYATAGGGVKMNMGFTTTVPDEKIDEKGKHVTCLPSTIRCQIRQCHRRKCFDSDETIIIAFIDDGGWQAGDDGYWYYESVLPAGETTKQELNISYQFPSGDEKASEFNVVVIQECTPVLFDANGNAYADWNHAVTADSGDIQE